MVLRDVSPKSIKMWLDLSGAPLDFLLIGGGGGGPEGSKSYGAGGGNAGCVMLCYDYFVNAGCYDIIIGQGGGQGGNGNASCFGNMQVNGGCSGSGATYGVSGGCGACGGPSGTTGGPGIINDISGVNECYAWGGSACGQNDITNVTYGSGGRGGGTRWGAGCPGCQGVFILRYPTSCGYSVTGGCCYTCGDYTIHCFTSNGTLCVN